MERPILPKLPQKECTIIQVKDEALKGSPVASPGLSPVDQGYLEESFPRKKDSRESRKRARKTAHSDIEKKRRTKINEQFEVLKQMVPACAQFKDANGKDSGLHKLVILQETVNYMRYLKETLGHEAEAGVYATPQSTVSLAASHPKPESVMPSLSLPPPALRANIPSTPPISPDIAALESSRMDIRNLLTN